MFKFKKINSEGNETIPPSPLPQSNETTVDSNLELIVRLSVALHFATNLFAYSNSILYFIYLIILIHPFVSSISLFTQF